MRWEYIFADTRVELRDYKPSAGAMLALGPSKSMDVPMTGRKRSPERNAYPEVDTTRLCGHVAAWRMAVEVEA